jgi:hypothetical protein
VPMTVFESTGLTFWIDSLSPGGLRWRALIDKVRQIARSGDKPIWSVVEAAFESYIEE